MNSKLFSGELARLAALEAETYAEAAARWSRDSEYWRLAHPTPAQPRLAKYIQHELEREFESPEGIEFAIRTLADDRLIGSTGLWLGQPTHGEAWVGIHIGEREYWGKGYGTDAMRIILRYAFTELNLHRVSLSALATNARAIRSYEKAGFVVEGRGRHLARYEDMPWDEVFMGILREEWEDNLKRGA
jgi:RimJ/RimL family protein N-acetyltransferase